MHAMDDDEPSISGSSGHQALPEMSSPSEMFWAQFWDYLGKYGIHFVTATLIGGLTLGYVLHFFNNVIPARKAVKEQKILKQKEEEAEKEMAAEEAEIIMGDAVFKGTINSKVIRSLRRTVVFQQEPKSNRGLRGAMEDIEQEREELLGNEEKEDSGEDTMEEEEEEGEPLPLEDISGISGETLSGEEEGEGDKEETKDEKDLLGKLGTLHGKLATAQLRARTRKMQMEMSQEERQTEAEMRAKQLESIMSLMMQNKEKFGMSSDDVKEQLNMYNF